MGVLDQTNQQAKGLAQQVAQQMAREPLEVLGDVKRQVTGEQLGPRPEQQTLGSQQPAGNKIDTAALVEKDKRLTERSLQALNVEIRQISQNELVEKLNKEIAGGKEIALESYAQKLPVETMQVLKAHMQAVKVEKAKAASEQARVGLVQPTTVRGRGTWIFGDRRKQKAQEQGTHVEKPVQSST